jgi:hypothetical protein
MVKPRRIKAQAFMAWAFLCVQSMYNMLWGASPQNRAWKSLSSKTHFYMKIKQNLPLDRPRFHT